jgi:hypothetical protein
MSTLLTTAITVFCCGIIVGASLMVTLFLIAEDKIEARLKKQQEIPNNENDN